MYSKISTLLATFLLFALALSAASPAIGLIQATGDFQLNHAATRGNGTLFDGSLLETTLARTDVSLSSGGHLALALNSKARLYKDHAVLESGAVEVSDYKLIASNLAIVGPSAHVVLDSPNKLRVGALSSPVEVRNADNLLIARVTPGHTLAFESGGQGGASGPVSITGVLVKNGDKYTVTDQTTNVTYEVQGKDLDKKVGKKVKVVGSLVPGSSSAVPVVAATSITIAVVAGAAVAAGLSTAAIAGIVIGGATAAALGIAAGVGAFSNDASAK